MQRNLIPPLADKPDNKLSKSLGLPADHLGSSLAVYYAKFDDAELFEGSAHSLHLFGINNIQPANYYLLSELQKDEIDAALDSSDSSWQWLVIGDFNTKRESLILDPISQYVYIFNWVTYPRDQKLMAQNFDDLMRKLNSLENHENIYEIVPLL